MRQNKGSILKASVDYIKKLKRDQERLKQVEDRQRQMEAANRKMMLRMQVMDLDKIAYFHFQGTAFDLFLSPPGIKGNVSFFHQLGSMVLT